MVEIRKHLSVEAAVYISDLHIKLPEDHSWVVMSERFSTDDLESSRDLKGAFDIGLIEMRISGDYSDAPNWFLASYTETVRVPVELLDDNEIAAIQKIHNLKASAHPIMWMLIRSGLFEAESEGRSRPVILNTLIA